MAHNEESTGTAIAAWSHFLDDLRVVETVASQVAYPDDERTALEACRHLLRTVGQGCLFHTATDPDFPHWLPNFHWPNSSLGNGPDTTYYYTPIRSSGVYRIWGQRHNIHMVDFQIGESFFGSENGGNNKALISYDLDDIAIAADGSFEFLLSAERPAGWSGDWRHLPPTAETITLRQVAYDWLAERQAVIHIVRKDAPQAAPLRPTAAQHRQSLQAAAVYAKRTSAQFTQFVAGIRKRGYLNGPLFTTTFSEEGGLADQLYFLGAFDVKPDEALILETDMPQRCRYWNLQLTDEFLGALDYIFRHGSLNGHQACIDSDGRFRAVISHTDPGVANWLDLGGVEQGLLMGRWKGADSTPIPTIKKVPVSEIDRHLPSDTARVTEPQRAATVLARRVAMLQRIGH